MELCIFLLVYYYFDSLQAHQDFVKHSYARYTFIIIIPFIV